MDVFLGQTETIGEENMMGVSLVTSHLLISLFLRLFSIAAERSAAWIFVWSDGSCMKKEDDQKVFFFFHPFS